MGRVVIKAEGLGKMYRLGEMGTGTISHDLNRWFARIRGKEDPFAKIGQSNDRTSKASSADYVWAINDISFDLEEGSVLGIIGRNGAGKSTLLKVLSRITAPTKGSVKVKGRIASLLEVGTGFHPELTGRENIYMNGTILGMRKKEIDAKLDSIIDFAGVARYIDTPTKRYSSGMQVRLAFAVAAFLEPEILIVDEVLAVGDAEFQNKAIGKIQDVSRSEGRTVLFVSHNMDSIRAITKTAIVLEKGVLTYSGETSDVVKKYFEELANKDLRSKWINERDAGQSLRFISAELGAGKMRFGLSENIDIDLRYELLNDFQNSTVAINVTTSDKSLVLGSLDSDGDYSRYVVKRKGKYHSRIRIPAHTLHEGKYSIKVSWGVPLREIFQVHEDVLTFEVFPDLRDNPIFSRKGGAILPKIDWDIRIDQ